MSGKTEQTEQTVLRGSVENVVYHNDDNDYTVMEIISEDGKLLTAVGSIAGVAEGEDVTLYGAWTKHAEYGEQFAFTGYERELPTGKTAILRYLSSRTVKGVGPATAARIVARFGEETFDVIENHPEWLADISGISPKKAAQIHESFCEQTGVRTLMMFCRDYFPTAVLGRLYKKWGGEALEKLKADPYAVSGVVRGLTFEMADRFALSLSFAQDAPERVEGGVRYVLDYNAQTNGHTCLPEEKLREAVSEHLGVSPEKADEGIALAVARGEIVRFSDGGRKYAALVRYASAEKYIAEKLIALDKSCALFSENDAALFIHRIEEEQGIRYAAAQRRAITAALSNGVMVLTGGPGTGKTTVVRALLRIFEFAGLSVALLAPTGRAANRMSEATVNEAKTIHRALEMERSEDEEPIFRRTAAEPLDEQVFIIDETSMVDVLLAEAFLRAVKRGSRVIFIGDADQLPSVGAGRVLCDLIESGRFCTVCLEEIFRQSEESLIVTNAHKINHGILPEMDTKDKDFFFLPCPEDRIPDMLADLICRRLPKAYGERISSEIQVITPSRKGRAGTERLNEILQAAENPPAHGKKEHKIHGVVFREGDRVMQIRNNYEIEWHKDHFDGNGVFNGDTGFLTAFDEDGAKVRYDDREAIYEKDDLEELDHSYAITIHKSQGSEYPVVIIPLYACAPMLQTRNLLYTAVTRACRMVIMVGNREIVRRMVENDRHVLRYTALAPRLRRDTK